MPTIGEPWALILAGGEGVRLRSLTRLIAGDSRPKQFCRILGPHTLLEQTRRRAALLVDPARTQIVLTRPHARFFRSLLSTLPPDRAVLQPRGRGTAPAILYGLLKIATEDPLGTVVILPSDHYVGDEEAFMRHVATACLAVAERPELAVLLGIVPLDAEADYGWVEAGPPLALHGLRRVRRFWEKPAPAVARALYELGCLWNSFVIVSRVPTLLALIRQRLPGLAAAFQGAEAAVGTRGEEAAIEEVYGRLPSTSFSDDVLVGATVNLAVLPVHGVPWSDWGRPERVLRTLAGLGIEPEWAVKLRVAANAG
jgi:mannose-1-phosphate guanylyltransferase